MQYRAQCGLIACAIGLGLVGCPEKRKSEKSAPPPPAQKPAEKKEDPLPPLEDLPRLKLVWESDPVTGTALSRPTIGKDQAYVVREKTAVQALALDSGKPVWKAQTPAKKPIRLTLIGERLVATSIDGHVIAFEARTGKELWKTKDDCFFIFGLFGRGKAAVGTCMKRPDPSELSLDSMQARAGRPEMNVRGVDLESGKILWSFEPEGPRPPMQLAVDDEHFYFGELREPRPGDPSHAADRMNASTVSAHALSSGERAWSREVEDYAMSVTTVGKAVVVTGRNTTALDRRDGTVLWTVEGDEAEMVLSMDTMEFGVPVHAGLIVTAVKSELRGLDPETGRVARRWPIRRPEARAKKEGPGFPRSANVNIVADEKRLLLVLRSGVGALSGVSGYLLVWEGPEPRIFQSPMIRESFDVAGDLLLVARDRLEAYSLAETAVAEARLPPAERLAQVLQRQPVIGYHREEELGELEGIPDLGENLRKIAADKTSPLRKQAVDALRLVREPASVPILLSILDEPLPPKPDKKCERPSLRIKGDRPTVEQLEKIRNWQPSKACAKAEELFRNAQWLRQSAVRALAGHETEQSARRLAEYLTTSDEERYYGPGTDTRREIYRLLARVGGNDLEKILADLDRKRTPAATGWNHICQAADSRPKGKEPGRHGGADLLCGGRVKAGKLQVTGVSPGVWIRQRDGKAPSAPALAFQDGLAVNVQEAFEQEGKLVARGHATSRAVRETRPWSVEIDTGQALSDEDGDGIADQTEEFIGTDPKNKDSDGDGKSDGEDPSPLAGTGEAPERTELVKELLRYALIGNMHPVPVAYVYATKENQLEIDGVVSVVLHRDPRPERRRETPDAVVPGAIHLDIHEISISGKSATARIGVGGDRHRHHGGLLSSRDRLKLHRSGDTWRVVAVEKADIELKMGF